MYWLFLLLALLAFGVAFTTASPLVLALSLLAALALMLAWIMGLLSQRLGEGGGDQLQLIDPAELRRLREEAEARRNAAAAAAVESATLSGESTSP